MLTATETFINNFNKTTDFLNTHTSSSTTRLNILKSSLSLACSAGSYDLMKIGITQNTNGTLVLDKKAFTQALSKNRMFVERTLNNLTKRISASINLADDTSKSKLLSEQNKITQSKLTIDDITYKNIASLAKNGTVFKNYYYALSNSGIFMDISS